MDDWVFNLEDSLMDGFQEDQLMLADIPGVKEALAWKLSEIKRNPRMAGSVRNVDSDVVYVAKTGQYTSGAPPLLIAYLLNQKQRIIRLCVLCKADDDVEERIRRALRRRNRPRGH